MDSDTDMSNPDTNDYSLCCGMPIIEFIETHLKNEEALLNFCYEHNLVPTEKHCPKCKNICKINIKTYGSKFRCHKSTRGSNLETIKCNFSQSLFNGTFFHNIHLSKRQIILFVRYFCSEVFSLRHVCTEVGISHTTFTDWNSFCKEVCSDYLINNAEKIGGINKIVEINEAKFVKRKCTSSGIFDGVWILGGVERGSQKMFFVPVNRRDKMTLIKAIKENVEEGTTLMTDSLKAYDTLGQEGFHHLKVEDNIKSVDLINGTHTHNINMTWRDLRKVIPRYGTKKDFLDGHLSRFMFFRKFKDTGERMHNFFVHAGRMY